MYRLAYSSIATSPFSETELHEALTQWRDKNSRLNITGMLLYSNGNIFQVLEGHEQDVQSIFATIESDIRHLHVLKVADGTINERDFPDWSMGFKTVTGSQFEHVLGYVDPTKQEFLASHPDQGEGSLVALLKSFATEAQPLS
ncbi:MULTISPECIES: BLUF domain-containing protein [Hymenobacter]|nr:MULTISPECIES: BLUF domain-containing protein [Hymenobacter]MBC6991536.1 BLUF domain-containing protein [Hymenobacter sp. BT491]